MQAVIFTDDSLDEAVREAMRRGDDEVERRRLERQRAGARERVQQVVSLVPLEALLLRTEGNGPRCAEKARLRSLRPLWPAPHFRRPDSRVDVQPCSYNAAPLV